MALSIVLSEGIDRNWRPGSVLSGNVQLLAAKQQPLGQVAITFAGRCKVTIERRRSDHVSYYHSKGYYGPSDLSCLHTRIRDSYKVRTARAIPSSPTLPGEEQVQESCTHYLRVSVVRSVAASSTILRRS